MRYGILNQGHGRQQRDHSFSFRPRRKHRRIQEHDLDGLIAHLQDKLQIRPEQLEVWQRVAASLREAGPALQELRTGHTRQADRSHEEPSATERSIPLNERLDALEQRLHKGLEVLSKLRAPLAELNRVLDDRQREKLERWFAQRRWR